MSSIDLYIRVICKEIFNMTSKICIQLGRKAPSPEKQMQAKVEKFIVEEILDPIYNGPTDYITVKEIKGIWQDATMRSLSIHDDVDDGLLENLCKSEGALEIHVDVGIHVVVGEDNSNATVKRRSINWN
ncbi:hypothetical protein HYFRA_00011073 [Hymenoscyphus fraxineus]|uniref:Uncharacterized protein n=1 Tax=Hymenoscyphus fraxineus TaxID=746836 RepID=A0A9N9L4F7_9HELO|nr:hypothetical protein HYFRA_00011073 [Hymenoscyphus fraxineus]